MGRSQTGRPCGPHLWSPGHAARRLHRVLAALSLKGLRPLLFPCSGYVTHALLTLAPLTAILLLRSVRLACLSHAASVRSEPGSNSSRKSGSSGPQAGVIPNDYPTARCGRANWAPDRLRHTMRHCRADLVVGLGAEPRFPQEVPLRHTFAASSTVHLS